MKTLNYINFKPRKASSVASLNNTINDNMNMNKLNSYYSNENSI